MGRWGWGGGYCSRGGGYGYRGGGGRCYRCGRASHYANECFAKTHVDGHAIGSGHRSSSSASSSSSPGGASRKKAKTEGPESSSDFAYAHRGHAVSMAPVKKKGGPHEGKVRAVIRGPELGDKAAACYGKDAADARRIANAWVDKLVAGTAASSAPAASATAVASPAPSRVAAASAAPAAAAAGAAVAPTPTLMSSPKPSAALAAVAAVSPAAAAASGWTQDEMEDAFAAEDGDGDLAAALRLLATASLSVVGIRYYTGVAHPGEYVTLVREPRNPYDSNAIRVDNMHGEKVGHVKATQAKVLAPVMDRMAAYGVAKLDGSIPHEGDAWTLPLKLEIYGPDRTEPGGTTMPGQVLTAYLRDRVRGAFYVSYAPALPLAPPPPSSASSAPALPSVNVSTSVVVKEFKSQEELDSMFERQKAKLADLPEVEPPPQLRSKTKLLDHQKVGVAWMVHKENGGGNGDDDDDEEEVPFFRKAREKGRTVWLSEITNASQEARPPAVRGCILADDMGLGKTLQCISLILSNPPEGRGYPPGFEEEDNAVKREEEEEEEDDDDGDKKMPAAETGGGSATPSETPPPAAEDAVAKPEAPEAEPEPARAPAPIPDPEALAAARSINVTKIRAVPVKNLRWILSADCALGTVPYAHGMDADAVRAVKKPDLVKRCLEQLADGRLTAERFHAGASAAAEPPKVAAAAAAAVTPAAEPVAAEAAAALAEVPVAMAEVPTKPPVPAASVPAVSAVSTGVGLQGDSRSNVATVIVCPVSVMSNWVHQIEQHVKDGVLRVGVYQGPGRKAMLPDIIANKYDVVVVSYSILASDFKYHTKDDNSASNKRKLGPGEASLFDIDFHRVVLDEAHQIRNSKTRGFRACRALSCRRRVCLTGTPLQNRPEDVQSLFSFLGFEPLSDADVFRRSVAQPVRDGDAAGLSRLRLAMCHVALRRNKQTADVALGEREVQIRSVAMEPHSVHRNTYDVLFESARSAFRAALEISDKEALRNYMSILETLTRIRQACCSGELIPRDRIRRAEEVAREIADRCKRGNPLSAEEGRVLFDKLKGKFDEDAECAVCLSELPEDEAAILRPCSHFFCRACVRKLLGQSQKLCPLCRGPFAPSDVVKRSAISAEMTDEKPSPDANRESIADAETAELEQSPKVCALLAAIAEMKPDEKGVIFSQFTKFLDVIEKALRAHGHSYCRIDGKTKASDRITAMKVFNSGNGGPRFILCSLMAAGTGINLTRANHVYMLDLWWNKAVEDQAMDRCHRIGQTRKVRILKFVIADSIEERLIKMQEAKAALGKGAMQLLDAEEMRKTRIGALKDLFQISPDGSKE